MSKIPTIPGRIYILVKPFNQETHIDGLASNIEATIQTPTGELIVGSQGLQPISQQYPNALETLYEFNAQALLPKGTTLGVLVDEDGKYVIRHGLMPDHPPLTGLGDHMKVHNSTARNYFSRLIQQAIEFGREHDCLSVLAPYPLPQLDSTGLAVPDDRYILAQIFALNGTKEKNNLVTDISNLL
jgi:hypothetical protein